MNRKSFANGMIPNTADLTGFEDGIELAIKNLVLDRLGTGILTGLTVGENNPQALSVIVAPGVGYAADAPGGDLGQRIENTSNTVVDCTTDENGTNTSVAINTERWVSVVARFNRTPINQRQDQYMPQAAYMDLLEGVVLKVKSGASAGVGLAVKPAITTTEIVLCDIKITYQKATIINADINTSRRMSAWSMPALLTLLNAIKFDGTGQNGHIPAFKYGGAIASPANGELIVDASLGNHFQITGTNPITKITVTGSNGGTHLLLEFAGSLVITHDAGTGFIDMPNAMSITTTAGFKALFSEYTANKWRVAATSGQLPSDREVGKALASAYLRYNSASTVDIVFPYTFSDGSTWATIANLSVATTAKTNANIYWLGLYLDMQKAYSKTVAPVAGDIAFAYSTANNTEPARPTGKEKLGTYLITVGNGGGGADIQAFVAYGNRVLLTTGRTLNLSSNNTIQNLSAANMVPPNAIKILGKMAMSVTGTMSGCSSYFYGPGDADVLNIENLYATPAPYGSNLLTAKWFELPLVRPTRQEIRNYGYSTSSTGVTGSLTSNSLEVKGWEE